MRDVAHGAARALRRVAVLAAVGAAVLAASSGSSFSSAASPAHRDGRPKLPLAGKVVGIDPGHNGRNWTDPAFIDHLIWNGREQETCDTTGTQTDAGYTEAQFNWNVASFLAEDLRA